MVTTHSLGFPRIGSKRELKFSLEAYWKRIISEEELLSDAKKLRQENWREQSILDFVPVGDFSLYDQVLDMSFTLGNIPGRILDKASGNLDAYFMAARGQSSPQENGGTPCCSAAAASEMKKWFDTNYHYIVPEFSASTKFELNASRLIDQIEEAKAQNLRVKPVIIGPLSYLWLGKAKENFNKLNLVQKILPAYAQLLQALADKDIDWLQVDEPILVTDLDDDWQDALKITYQHLSHIKVKILLTTYFGALGDNTQLAFNLPVAGLHIDVISSKEELPVILGLLPAQMVLSLGVVDGRNIWKSDLKAMLSILEPIADKLHDRLWIAPSCSLLHVPVDLNAEQEGSLHIKSWLAFAVQKVEEIRILAKALNEGRVSVEKELDQNAIALNQRRQSPQANNLSVQNAVGQLKDSSGARKGGYKQRSKIQASIFNLPKFPTTTIGSFPQTSEIRSLRNGFKSGALTKQEYVKAMQNEISRNVSIQTDLGLDVFVHGEPERNDMVEYFGEQLDGFAMSKFGWVQSYGSRCVKPPILFGDVSRPKQMTVKWALYAQSLTDKPMKGMLTGPVTILNWSFVRNDQSLEQTCLQLALAIRDEVLDLERAGIKIIQIDEAALREGLPLRKSQWDEYLSWAIKSFRIAANGVKDKTQIHTHMCYSEFDSIINAITQMDADVITIETSRSEMSLMDSFKKIGYPNEIGPGVYDIHSPNIPTKEQIVSLMKGAAKKIPIERLWINPDCGLKTRNWEEVMPALKNMVEAAKELRTKL